MKQLVKLRDRRPRDEERVFLVEGYREIRRALEKKVAWTNCISRRSGSWGKRAGADWRVRRGRVPNSILPDGVEVSSACWCR